MEQIEAKTAQLSATMGDQQIIQLFFQRCEEAITQTQKKYGALCRSVAQRLLTDPRDTEECVSDTYLRVWNAIPPERPRSLRAYLARITRNLALDRYNYNTAAQRSTALTDAFEELEPWIVAGQGDPDTE
ncbi:RNA polymerase sigma factor, partial [Dysosmobacter sp.]|uniref:RNA polymerase sigma factor n=1 Tax=Dysosmobacter sp. TaxID=2591382 RepID=UPI003A8E2C8D